MSVRALAVLGVPLVVAGALAGFFLLVRDKASGQAVEETRLARVKVVAARVLKFGEWTELLGVTQLSPDKIAHVSAAVDGRVLHILGDGAGQALKEGELIEPGHILVQLDDSVPRAYRQQLAALGAALNREKQSGAALPLLLAALKALDAQIAQFSIRAPFAGVLGPIQVTPGQAIRAGTTVADLVNLDQIDVLCYVPQGTVRRLALAQVARLQQDKQRGKVVFIAAQADPDTGNYAVKVRFSNANGRLRLNSVVRVLVLTQPEKDRLTIPEDALLEDMDPPLVMVAQNNSPQDTANGSGQMRVPTALSLRPVLGVRDRELRLVEILQLRGAQSGDLVSIRDVRFIIEGGAGLHDNDALRMEGDSRPSEEAVKLEEMQLNTTHARVTIAGETASALAIAPDGKTLVSGGQDGAVKIWEIATGKNIGVMPRRSKSITALAVRPDGKLVAAGIRDGTVVLWDIGERKSLLSIGAHYRRRNVVSLAFSPDGKTLASVGHDEPVIKLWDPISGKLRASWRGHTNYIGPILYRPDGKVLVSGAEDATLRLWDVRSGKALQILEGSPSDISALAMHNEGKTVVAWSKIPGKGENPSGKSAVMTWDVASGRNVSKVEGESGQKTPYLGCFSPDASILAWAAGEPVITLWETASARMIGTLQGHTSQVLALAFSPEGKHLASGSADGTIRIWELPNRKGQNFPWHSASRR